MYFNSISVKENSLYHDALDLAGIIDTAQFPIVRFCRYANAYLRKANTWISQASGTWQFDDRNWTTLLTTVSDLTAATKNYEIPENIRTLEGIDVMDNNGDYYPITPIEKTQHRGRIGAALDQYYETDGFPEIYDAQGKWVVLYPGPAAANITTTDGIRYHFTRDISPFAATDTVTEPGVDNHYHRIISLGSAYDFCVGNGIGKGAGERQSRLWAGIRELKEDMQKHYGNRHTEHKKKIVPVARSPI